MVGKTMANMVKDKLRQILVMALLELLRFLVEHLTGNPGSGEKDGDQKSTS